MTAPAILTPADSATIAAITGRATIRAITRQACVEAGVRIEDVTGPCRRAELCVIRRRIWSEARALGYSLPQIGRVFGRDHTTILHGLRVLERAG